MDFLSWLRTQWDRVLAWSLVGLGAVLVLAGGKRVSDARVVADQLSFMLSAGLGGLLALGAGVTLLISAGLADVWRRLHRLTSRRPTPTTPTTGGGVGQWTVRLGWALFGGAAVLLVAGSRGSAGAASDPEQVAFLISGGLSAVLVGLVGAALVLGADMESIAAELVRVRPDPAPSGRPAFRSGVVVGVVGAVMVSAGWVRAAGTAEMHTALSGLALAGAGVAVVALVLAVVGVRWRRAVLGDLAVLSTGRPPVTDPESHPEARRAPTRPINGFYTVSGLGRFHHSSCAALASTGGERQPVTRTQTGLEPCLLCVED